MSDDIVLSAGDEVTVSFDVATSEPEVATTVDLDAVFNSLSIFGSSYTGKWSNPSTLLITIGDALVACRLSFDEARATPQRQ